MEIGAALAVETAAGLYARRLKPMPQTVAPGDTLRTAPRIFPADTVIHWRESAVRVHNFIRGLSPYPGAMTILHRGNRSFRLKILEGRLITDIRDIPGTVSVADRDRLFVSCLSGGIEILTLVPEGRKRMSAAEFLRGFDIEGWEVD
jgi:methionyl-tRNA formyltransferase